MKHFFSAMITGWFGAWRGAAVLVLALLVPMVGRAQEGTSGIYRDRIEPHWFNQGTDTNSAFWYRLDFAGSKREFVRVDAVKGTREPAFMRRWPKAAFSH